MSFKIFLALQCPSNNCRTVFMRHSEPRFILRHHGWLVILQIMLLRLLELMSPRFATVVEMHKLNVGEIPASGNFLQTELRHVGEFRIKGAIVFGQDQEFILAGEFQVDNVHVISGIVMVLIAQQDYS